MVSRMRFRKTTTTTGTLLNKSFMSCTIAVHMYYIEDITQWREDMNFMFEWHEQYLTSKCSQFLPREHKIHIMEPTCYVFFFVILTY